MKIKGILNMVEDKEHIFFFYTGNEKYRERLEPRMRNVKHLNKESSRLK